MAAACGVELVEIKELGSCARERELEHIGKLALAPPARTSTWPGTPESVVRGNLVGMVLLKVS
jgi:hypothetical protein